MPRRDRPSDLAPGLRRNIDRVCRHLERAQKLKAAGYLCVRPSARRLPSAPIACKCAVNGHPRMLDPQPVFTMAIARPISSFEWSMTCMRMLMMERVAGQRSDLPGYTSESACDTLFSSILGYARRGSVPKGARVERSIRSEGARY